MFIFYLLSFLLLFIDARKNIFGVVNELKDPTQTRVDAVSSVSIFTAFLLYAIVAGVCALILRYILIAAICKKYQLGANTFIC
jgi:hypothetical protein